MAETMARYATCKHLIRPNARITVAYYSDNTGNVRETQRGWSTRAGHFVPELIHQQFPNVRFLRSQYTPGVTIPMDEQSRGLAMVSAKLTQFCAEHNLPEPREFIGRSGRDHLPSAAEN